MRVIRFWNLPLTSTKDRRLPPIRLQNGCIQARKRMHEVRHNSCARRRAGCYPVEPPHVGSQRAFRTPPDRNGSTTTRGLSRQASTSPWRGGEQSRSLPESSGELAGYLV